MAVSTPPPPPPPPPGAARAPGPAAVELAGLRKRFGDKVAVDDLWLTVPSGSFYGLVGPNGAGKTTTLRVLTGLLRPDGGFVRVAGVDVWPDPTAAKVKLGLVPDGLTVFERLTGAEMLVYAGMLRGLDETESRARASALLGALGLAGDAGALIVDYSHGMRKKVVLASALIHRPDVLVLDEPFEGIDPVSSSAIREVLQRYREAGGTVLFSSHVMEVVERLCDHVAIIAQGRILAAGPLDALPGGRHLEEVFLHVVGGGGTAAAGDLSWLRRGGS
jgi:ABC-2 type transport system ATP-binding protein